MKKIFVITTCLVLFLATQGLAQVFCLSQGENIASWVVALSTREECTEVIYDVFGDEVYRDGQECFCVFGHGVTCQPSTDFTGHVHAGKWVLELQYVKGIAFQVWTLTENGWAVQQ